MHVEFNGVNRTGTMVVPNTGGWQTYRDVTATVTLTAGQQAMRVSFDTESSNGAVGNLNYIRLASASAPPPPPPPTGTKLKVMTWNVHFGKNTSNVLNLEAQANIMANSGAHVILLQESSTWDGDQPNRFPELLRARTGHTWYKVWAPHVGTAGEGTLILTRLPIVASSTANFYDRGFGRVVVKVNGVNVTLFNLHFMYEPSSRRTLQLDVVDAVVDRILRTGDRRGGLQRLVGRILDQDSRDRVHRHLAGRDRQRPERVHAQQYSLRLHLPGA